MQQITSLAQLAALGRGNDSLIAHINPEEASLLKMLGGSGTVNPDTGLRQFDADSGGGDGVSGSSGPGTAGHGRAGGIGGNGDGNDRDSRNGGLGSNADGLGDALSGISNGDWGGGPGSQRSMGANGEGAVSGTDYDSNPGGWGMNGFSTTKDGMPDGPAGFDSPGYGMSTAANQAKAQGFSGPTSGGIGNGPLGGVLGALNTLASFAVPGYAPVGLGLSLANTALGATNSLGLTNTGQLSPSLGEALGLSPSGAGLNAMGDVTQGMPGYGASPTSPGVADAQGMGMVGQPGMADAAPAAPGAGALASGLGAVPGQPTAGANSRDALTQALLAQSPALASVG